MASGNIFKLLAEIKALKLDYAGAVRYLTERGIEVVGIVKQGLDNFFKKNKARDVDFGNVVQKLPIDDAGIPFNPNTLKSTAEKRGVENLFKGTKRVNIPAEKLNHKIIAEQAGIDIELIRGKDWLEILEILKGKADGGRVGFETGGSLDRSTLNEQGQAIYDSMKSARHTDQSIIDALQSLGLYDVGGDATGIETIVNTQPIITQGGDGEVDVRSYVPLSERNKVTIPSLTENQLAQKALWENQKWTPQMEANKAYWENQPDVSTEEDVGFWEGMKNRAGDFWSGITGSKAGQAFNKFAITPMMAMANYRNPLNPAAVNFNPMLRQQKDLALRPTDMGGFGFTQDDIGRFLGSANPEDEDYNPLLGQNLVSGWGTNDLTQMLRNKLQKIQNRKIAQTDSSRLKQEKIQELISQAVADESAGYTGTPGGNVGSGVFATMDQSGKTYGPYTSQETPALATDDWNHIQRIFLGLRPS